MYSYIGNICIDLSCVIGYTITHVHIPYLYKYMRSSRIRHYTQYIEPKLLCLNLVSEHTRFLSSLRRLFNYFASPLCAVSTWLPSVQLFCCSKLCCLFPLCAVSTWLPSVPLLCLFACAVVQLSVFHLAAHVTNRSTYYSATHL